ncbi:nucleoside diphosphate kinase regulator [Rhizobium sp. S152]|uniref:nucleoside diphosphate kinase regulator n=1 Tax=Rhizobium sp. S152 TaxID=3055038 RepID=UPI0025AA1562|nr:nucleoside diphosphate kinase regulator [Rhizobium sp. S152]MDM9627748.1 nucleoside diphosphate kinase regulator [Rhizobium sp. S152]
MASKKSRKPAIATARSDHDRLTKLAESLSSQIPELSDELLAELERARVVDDAKLPQTVVRMGSSLRYTSDLGEDRSVTLVYPGEADIAKGRISILTPIGAALIGLSAGQSIDWKARDGRAHRLTVREVWRG